MKFSEVPFVIQWPQEKWPLDVSTRLKDAADDSIYGYLRVKAVSSKDKLLVNYIKTPRETSSGPL